jgi:PAS domain S-box-containing protein
VFSQGSVRDYELDIQHRDGHITPVLYNANLYKDEKGKTIGVFAAARDMTEIKRMEEERTRLVAAVEQSAEGVLITDKKGFTVYVNRAFEGIAGHAKGDIMGRRPDVMTKESQDQWYSSIRDVLLHGNAWTGRVELMKKDGAIREVDLTVSPVKDASGAVINYVSVGRDVTGQVKLEKELRQAQKMEAVGTLAGGIAHDFNNILAGIIGFTEMSLEDIADAKPVSERLDLILKGAHRGRDLVRQILTFSRKGEPEKKPTNLRNAIEEISSMLKASIPSTIEIRRKIMDTDQYILADRIQIHQILMNLCSNAAHAMNDSGGLLEIGLEDVEVLPGEQSDCPDLQPGRYMKLSVSDTGRGMDRSTVEHIFEPFFTTKNPGEGTGMGLSVVHGIVKGHNGEITVKSEINKGSIFQLYFPVLSEGTPIQDTLQQKALQGKERILFVDDEPDIVTVNKDRLQRLGYDVVATTNSLDALKVFRANPDSFDLIITDYTMPHLTGVDLANEIRRMRSDIPIILCSGIHESPASEKSKKAGITEFAMKPLSKKEFSAIIRKVLDRGV